MKLDIMNAEIQHEIDAIETQRKWHKICAKLREEKLKGGSNE